MHNIRIMFNALFNKKRMRMALICAVCLLITYKLASDIITYSQINGYVMYYQDNDVDNKKCGFIYNGKEYVKFDKFTDIGNDIGINGEALNVKKRVYFHYGKSIDFDDCVYGFEHDPYEKIFITGTLDTGSSIMPTIFVQKDFTYPDLYHDAIYKIELALVDGKSIIIDNSGETSGTMDSFVDELKTDCTMTKSLTEYGKDIFGCNILIYYDNVPLSERIGTYDKNGFQFSERYQMLNKNIPSD